MVKELHLSSGFGSSIISGDCCLDLHGVEGAARGYAKLVGTETKPDSECITDT